MRQHDLSPWRHSHDFTSAREQDAERRTRWVIGLTLCAMAVELTAGWLTGSMALLADGWHMGSHAAALGIAAFAYAFARRRGRDPRFTFGTGKVSSLAGYSSALLLAAGALWMAVESFDRLLEPVAIHYEEAIAVAAFGLVVNLASAWLLGHHGHDHPAPGPVHRGADGAPPAAASGPERHQDHNLEAAYLHVLADALTSVLALVALGLGLAYGWSFLDPLMGLAGALLIGRWAYGLARESAQVLLDAGEHDALAGAIRTAVECDADTAIADLHVWRIAPAGSACIVSLVTHDPKPPEQYRRRLAGVPGLLHVTVEVNQCRQPACRAGRYGVTA